MYLTCLFYCCEEGVDRNGDAVLDVVCVCLQVTLIPRGQARGLTWFIPGEDPTLISKQQIFARIVGALGGRAAEEVIFGDAEVTTGASSDLQQVCSPTNTDCLTQEFLLIRNFLCSFLLHIHSDS